MRNQLGKATALAIMGEAAGGSRDRSRAGQAALAGEMGAGLGAACLPCQAPQERCWEGLPQVPSPPVAPGDKLWWADQVSEKMGTCNKADGSGSVVLRNSTTLVMHMKVYDETIQLGETGLRGQGGEVGVREVKAAGTLGQGSGWE